MRRRPQLPGHQLTHAKAMRSNPTAAEHKLWQALRAGRLNGLKVRRQIPIGPFIADFVIPSARLVIELDGGQHGENSDYDGRRTEWLGREGYTVLRFWNLEVRDNLAGVLSTILANAAALSPLALGRESPDHGPGQAPSPLKGEAAVAAGQTGCALSPLALRRESPSPLKGEG